MYFIYPMLFLTIICLFYLVYEDLKTREVNVIPIYLLSCVGLIYNLYFGIIYQFYKMYLLQLVIIFIFLIIIYLLGKLTVYAYIGEGDLLTIMMISFTSGYAILFSEFVFLMSLAFMFFIPIVFFIYNVIKKNNPDYVVQERFWLLFLGFPKKTNQINSFFTPLEKFKLINGRVKSEILIKPDCNSENQIQEIKEFSKIHKIKRIWVSPLIPFIWPIFIAYIVIIFFMFFKYLQILGPFASFFI